MVAFEVGPKKFLRYVQHPEAKGAWKGKKGGGRSIPSSKYSQIHSAILQAHHRRRQGCTAKESEGTPQKPQIFFSANNRYYPNCNTARVALFYTLLSYTPNDCLISIIVLNQ